MPERPRILQMGPDPSIGGGMAAAIRGLLTSPLAERYELEVVPTYRGPGLARGLAVYCVALARLTVWCLRGRGRIVHVHATVRGSTYRKSVCVLLAKALRRRVVLQVHSGAGDIAEFSASRGRISLALFRAGFAAADAVLAVSGASAEALGRAYGVFGVEVVRNAAPFVPPFRRESPLPESGVHIAYLGGFANPAKGGETMVAALELALAREPRLRVTLAGPGELTPAGAELLARHPSVAWAGWLEPDEKDELLRAAHLFAMSSRSEGLPMALLEAMAYGMAIVATGVGGIPEVLDSGQEGLLVAPRGARGARRRAVLPGRRRGAPRAAGARRASAGRAARRGRGRRAARGGLYLAELSCLSQQGDAYAPTERRLFYFNAGAPRGRARDQPGQRAGVPDRDHGAGLPQRTSQLRLVVVYVLAEASAARDDERNVALAAGTEDAADPRMGDHRVGFAEALQHLVEGHIGLGAGDARRRLGGPVLDDQFVAVEIAEGVEQPIEALVVSAHGDEDHRIPPA